MANVENKSTKTWNIILWIAQVALGALFIMAGTMKSFTPIAELGAKMSWVSNFSDPMVRFVGISELAGGLGLILPTLLRIQPKLTPIAAIGLLVIMLMAMAYHLNHGEEGALFNTVLGLVAAFIAWGRTVKAPILPKK